ncbi:MAG: MgtC/SapB family protein, partial [Verrucomicrobia bacterium]|nr:MgtC/SapB family protein [Verrucomicrobiota bacterium]
MQRERTNSRLAGFRTFPLITLLGAVCAHLAESFGPWIVAVGLAGLIGLLIVGNLPSVRPKEPDPGLTSEVAMLVMFAVGALLIIGQTALAIAIGGTVAVLLHLKSQMHDFASRIGDRDFTAVMQFALITLVILPVLPNQFYGPYLVLNPFKIWLMVVLIVGISLGGY